MIARINAKPEKALREALALAVTITGYVVIDACGAQWPVRSSVQRIARALATKSTNAERLRLDSEEIEAYLSRTVLGPERLEDVLPDESAFTRLPMVMAGEALAVYGPKEKDIWAYLDQIETAIETAWTQRE